MTGFTLDKNQKPSEETLKRLSELKDEDIVYDDDCPEMTPKMQKALAYAAAQRNQRLIKKTHNPKVVVSFFFTGFAQHIIAYCAKCSEGVKSVNEAIALIEEAERDGIEIEVLDLDHNLGDYYSEGGDGINLLDWLAERETFYPIENTYL